MKKSDFSAEDISAIYRVIEKRRDVRKFLGEQIPDDILHRILKAGSQAPSVGYMQPWNFLLLRDLQTRKKVYDAFEKANNEAIEMFEGERKETYKSLKLEGILESPLNICVTCDRTRFGSVILGKTCQVEMDLYSTVCAVQNLWLAARAEGIGIGWVSIINQDELHNILKLPDNITIIAYLCVGYTDVFAQQPELKTKNWLPEIPFPDLVFYDNWGNINSNL